MKTIHDLHTKVITKGYAKIRTWEMEQKQGEYIRLKHYGTTVLDVNYTTSPATVTVNSTSQSDTRGINVLLTILKLKPYKNSLKSFIEWCNDNPTPFHSDNVEGTTNYTRIGKTFIESQNRVNFLNENQVLRHVTHYEYDNDRKSFSHIESFTSENLDTKKTIEIIKSRNNN